MLEKLQSLKITDGILVLGFLLVIVGIGMNFKDQFLEKTEVKVTTKNPTPTVKNDVQVDSEVIIDIAGEVIHPGVYKLKNGARVNEALIMAGGLGAKADRDWVEKNLNQAEKLVDGEKIFIPKTGEKNPIVTQVLGSSTSKIIRLNTATVEDLDKLTGIGPAIAQRIIDYRTKVGGFKNIEELKLVSGVGDKLFEKIKDEISL
jgi:competence protein ComEA